MLAVIAGFPLGLPAKQQSLLLAPLDQARANVAGAGEAQCDGSGNVILASTATGGGGSAGGGTACVILNETVGDSNLRCWGSNGYGQIGRPFDYGTIGKNYPMQFEVPTVPLGEGRTALAVDVGRGYHVCAILDAVAGNSNLKCWGYATVGQLGYDMKFPQLGTAMNSESRNNGVCLKDGVTPTSNPGCYHKVKYECTYEYNVGEMGTVNLGAGRTAVAVSVGAYHTCAILDQVVGNSNVKCWGQNSKGQLGLDMLEDKTGRKNVGDQQGDMAALETVNLGPGRTAVAIHAGMTHTCVILDAVDGNSNVKCWGSNTYGELGLDGGTGTTGTTKQLGSDPGDMDKLGTINLGPGRTALSFGKGGGSMNTCVILDAVDGYSNLKCWGYNARGSLGVEKPAKWGNMADLPTVNLGQGRTAVAVAHSYLHTCAILDSVVGSSNVKCWGEGTQGQLGYNLAQYGPGIGSKGYPARSTYYPQKTLDGIAAHSGSGPDKGKAPFKVGGDVQGTTNYGDPILYDDKSGEGIWTLMADLPTVELGPDPTAAIAVMAGNDASFFQTAQGWMSFGSASGNVLGYAYGGNRVVAGYKHMMQLEKGKGIGTNCAVRDPSAGEETSSITPHNNFKCSKSYPEALICQCQGIEGGYVVHDTVPFIDFGPGVGPSKGTCATDATATDATATDATGGSSSASVHGDPMFKVNGTGTHFWLKEGNLTPLLESGDVTLSGKTFNRPDTGHQWFDEFVVSNKGKAVLDVATVEGQTQVKLNGKVVSSGKLNADGVEVEFDTEGIKAKAGALAVTIYSSQATKFASDTDKAKYEHLNINFASGIPTDAKGIFAELAGVQEMSEATTALLKQPKLF
jgi:hypothetical protein